MGIGTGTAQGAQQSTQSFLKEQQLQLGLEGLPASHPARCGDTSLLWVTLAGASTSAWGQVSTVCVLGELLWLCLSLQGSLGCHWVLSPPI